MSELRFPPKPEPDDPKSARDDDQRIFDTVVGPNLRLRDNLIQLAVVIGGLALGAGLGAVINRAAGNDPILGAVVGGFAGVVLSLLLSGAIIGLVRFILALRRR